VFFVYFLGQRKCNGWLSERARKQKAGWVLSPYP